MKNEIKSIRVNVISINYNDHNDSINLIESIVNQKNKQVTYKIFLIDNSNNTKHVEKIFSFASKKLQTRIFDIHNFINTEFNQFGQELIIVKANQNLGFSRANNLAYLKAKLNTDYCLIANNDIIMPENFSANYFSHEKVKSNWCSSCIISDGTSNKYWYKCGKNSLEPFFRQRHHAKGQIINFEERSIKADFVSGAFFCLNVKYFKSDFIFNEYFYFGEEDSEFCKRETQKHGLIEVLQNVSVCHMIGQARKKKSSSWRIQNGLNSKLTLYILYTQNYFKYIVFGIFYLTCFWLILYPIKYLFKINIRDTINLFKFSIKKFNWILFNFELIKNQENFFTNNLIDENY